MPRAHRPSFRPSRTAYQQTEICEVCGVEEGFHFPNR